ncbi:MAG: hypothetical protein WB662_01985, partial [Methyloceanibacter sp.]
PMTERREYYFIMGQAMLPEPYHLPAIGLPNIWLLNGVTFEDDPDYGQLVSIQKLSGHTVPSGCASSRSLS